MDTSDSGKNHLHSPLQNQTQQTSEAHGIFLQIVAHKDHRKRNRSNVCIRPTRMKKIKNKKNHSSSSCFPILAKDRFYGSKFCFREAKYFCYLQKYLVSAANVSSFPRQGNSFGEQCFRDDVLKLTIGLELTISELPFISVSKKVKV